MAALNANAKCPMVISPLIHRQIKAIAKRRGMKIQALTDLALSVWLALPEKKAFPKK